MKNTDFTSGYLAGMPDQLYPVKLPVWKTDISNLWNDDSTAYSPAIFILNSIYNSHISINLPGTFLKMSDLQLQNWICDNQVYHA